MGTKQTWTNADGLTLGGGPRTGDTGPGAQAELSTEQVDALLAPQQAAPNDLDWLSLRSRAEWAALAIPSPYAPGHVLHPSVVYFENGWRGYRWWMAYTPYPNADAESENPCVAASNDLATWVAMGPQPLEQSPAGAAFNSDTDLAYDAANDRLALVYRVVSASTMQLVVKVSSDGVAWSAPVTIYTGTGVAGPAATDIASPSLMFNSATSRWEILGHNVKDNASAWPFVEITSANLLSGWDSTFATLTFAPPSGRKWWHSQFRRLPGGAYVGLVQDNNGTLGSTGNLFAAYSADGATFTYRQLEDGAVTNLAGWYRPSFVVRQDPIQRAWQVDAFGSNLNTSAIAYQVLEFGAANEGLRRASEVGALMYAAVNGGGLGILHADNFNRSDDATGLGTATGGGTYTQPGGPTNVIGVIGNQAYNVTTGNCRAVRDMGTTDYEARVTLAAKAAEQYLVVRYIDANNNIRIGVTSGAGQLRFQRVTGGAVAVDLQLGTTPLAGDEIKARCAGGEITIYRNGRRIAKVIDMQGVPGGQSVGMAMSGTLGGRMENLIVTALA